MQLNDDNPPIENNSQKQPLQTDISEESKQRIKNGTLNTANAMSKLHQTTDTNDNISNDFIADNFVLLSLAGKGAFGEIYLSYSLRDDLEVAIKKEQKRFHKPSQLLTEAKIYQTLLNINPNDDLSGVKGLIQQEVQGVPKFYGVGELPNSYYLIIEFLGPNLNDLLTYCKTKCFSIPCVCLIAIQFMNRLEILHKNSFIHRDIKPENFVIGTDTKSNVIYLVDFGLARRYRNPKNNQHIPYREGRPLTGTARYVSVNTHLGIEQSRRDDLESIGYMLLYFLKGTLPWKGLHGGDNKYTRIMEKKLQIPSEVLCEGLPDEMGMYMRYCKNLKFEDRPDYDYLRGLFVQMLGHCINVYGITKEYLKFDWNFRDRKHSIWKFFKKRNPSHKLVETSIHHLNTHYKLCSEVSSVENQNANSNSTSNIKKIEASNGMVSSQSRYGRNLTKIDEGECDSTIIKKHGDINYKLTIPKPDGMLNSEHSEISGSVPSSNNTLKNYIQTQTEEKEQSNLNDNDNENEYESNLSQRTEENSFITKDIFNQLLPEGLNFVSYNNNREDIDKYISNLMNKAKPIINNKIVEVNEENSVSNENNKDNEYQINPTEYFDEDSEEDKQNEQEDNDDDDNEDDEDENEEEHTKAVSQKQRIQPKNSEYITRKRLQNNNNNNNNNDNTSQTSKHSSPIQTLISKNSSHRVTTPTPNNSNSADKTNIINKTHSKCLKEQQSFENKILHDVETNSVNNPRQSKIISHQLSLTNVDLLKISKENIIKINTAPLFHFYKIEGDLGSGSFGQVKKVLNIKLKEHRAMKIVSKKSKYSKNEIEILKKISHPNIINIYEIFEDTKKYYIMYELIEGGELFDAITTQGYFSEKDACVVMKQILQAVNYLHTMHIVHRDLKPENIMMVTKSKFEVKIIDFGTAKQIKPKQKINEFIGTCYYIAPEVLDECYDEKCDIWSCGVIMYILLGGYPPFNGNSNSEIYTHIKNSRPSFIEDEWKGISEDAIELIKAMLRKNPSTRITAEQALNYPWFKLYAKQSEIEQNKNINKQMNQEMQMNAITKMKNFVKENRLKQAVLQFISTQFNLQREEEKLRDIFKHFDQDKKGMITKDIFKKELTKHYGFNDAQYLTEKLFGKLDLDGSGEISYNEFLTSLMDDMQVVTLDRLDKAFRLFDKDGNGKLSIEEIMHVFGGNGNAWKQVIQEIDINNDGEVDFEEFKTLMLGLNSQKLI